MTNNTIELKPSPEGYARTLLAIIEKTTKAEDRRWAEGEVIKAFKAAAQLNPEAWRE